MPPAVSTAARRAKRVIESASPSASSAHEDVEKDELDDESEDADGSDDDFSAAPTPEPSNVKIKLRVAPGSASAVAPPSGGRSRRAAAVAATAANAASAAKEQGGSKRKRPAKESEEEEVEEEEEPEAEPEEEDELEVEVDEGNVSPTKMTARQRAKQNKDMQETLLVLPDGLNKPKAILTEAERLQKREEMARRRKRQNEQRLQDEQDQTINRLLRAQTGRSRSKLDNPSPMPEGTESGRASGAASPTKRTPTVMDGIHFESRMKGDKLVLSVAVPRGREEWIQIGDPASARVQADKAVADGKPLTAAARTPQPLQPRNMAGACAVPGCAQPRKYRCTQQFEVGGCSLEHLKQVEQGLKV